MLYRPGDTDGDIQIGTDRLTGLSDLEAIRNPPGIRSSTRSPYRAAQGLCERFEQIVEGLGAAETATAGNNDRCFLQCEFAGAFFDIVFHSHGIRLTGWFLEGLNSRARPACLS